MKSSERVSLSQKGHLGCFLMWTSPSTPIPLRMYTALASTPRPLLVKFIRAADATRILSKRGSSRGSPIVIKPDMSPNGEKMWIITSERKMVSRAVGCSPQCQKHPWFSFTCQKQALWSSLELWLQPSVQLSKVTLCCQWQCCLNLFSHCSHYYTPAVSITGWNVCGPECKWLLS